MRASGAAQVVAEPVFMWRVANLIGQNLSDPRGWPQNTQGQRRRRDTRCQ